MDNYLGSFSKCEEPAHLALLLRPCLGRSERAIEAHPLDSVESDFILAKEHCSRVLAAVRVKQWRLKQRIHASFGAMVDVLNCLHELSIVPAGRMHQYSHAVTGHRIIDDRP